MAQHSIFRSILFSLLLRDRFLKPLKAMDGFQRATWMWLACFKKRSRSSRLNKIERKMEC